MSCLNFGSLSYHWLGQCRLANILSSKFTSGTVHLFCNRMKLFSGKTFQITMNPHLTQQKQLIAKHGGQIVMHSADILIGFQGKSSNPFAIDYSWIEDCVAQNTLLPFEGYKIKGNTNNEYSKASYTQKEDIEIVQHYIEQGCKDSLTKTWKILSQVNGQRTAQVFRA